MKYFISAFFKMYNIMSNPIEALLQINVLFNNEQNIHSLPSFFSPPPHSTVYLAAAFT